MKKIGIFCSASENIDKMYFDSARQIGEWMGKAGKTLIYGGANLGLMECVARAVKENGGTVIGVVPAKLEEKGSVSTLLDEVIHTRNLSDRKDVITHPQPHRAFRHRWQNHNKLLSRESVHELCAGHSAMYIRCNALFSTSLLN